MFTEKFLDKNELIQMISETENLKRFFCNGGCSHLAKILFSDLTDKRKEKDLFLFCAIKKRLKRKDVWNDDSKNILKTPQEEFFGDEKYFGIQKMEKLVIVDHVAFVSSGVLYDAAGIFKLNKNFDHPVFYREKYNYYILPLNKDVKTSESVLNNMIKSHALYSFSKKNIFDRVMFEIKNR